MTIFQAEPAVARAFFREWTKDSPGRRLDEVPDMRDLVDWGYYTTRLASAIQKIISIPAALQHVPNPCPRVTHPDWLHKMVREKDDKFKQRKLADLFGAHDAKRELLAAKDPNAPEHDAAHTPGKKARGDELDMEDVAGAAGRSSARQTVRGVRRFSAASRTRPRAAAASRPPPATGAVAARRPRTLARPPDGGNVTGNVRRRNALDPVERAREALESLGACPDKREDFDGWLRHHKAKWRLQRAERKRRRVRRRKTRSRARPASWRRRTPGFGRSAARPRTSVPAARRLCRVSRANAGDVRVAARPDRARRGRARSLHRVGPRRGHRPLRPDQGFAPPRGRDALAGQGGRPRPGRQEARLGYSSQRRQG